MASLGQAAEKSNGKAPGWFGVRNDIFDALAAKGPYHFTIFCAMLRHADDDGLCWPSNSRLSKLTGICKRKVISTIRELEELGLIQNLGPRTHKSNDYLIKFTGAPHAPHSAQDAPPSAPDAPALVHDMHPNRCTECTQTRPIEQDPLNKTQEQAAWLAREWLNRRGGAHTDHDRKSADNFEDLLAAGVSVETITGEITRRDRPKTEPIWDLMKRLMPNRRQHGNSKDNSDSQLFKGTATPL